MRKRLESEAHVSPVAFEAVELEFARRGFVDTFLLEPDGHMHTSAGPLARDYVPQRVHE